MNPISDRKGNFPLWTAYTVAALICWFFFAGIFANFPILGCVPCCLPVVAAVVAVQEGSFSGAVFGLCAGLFVCLVQGGEGAGLIFFGAVIGMLAGLWKERRLKRRFLTSMISAWLALAGVELLRVLTRLVFRSAGSFEAVLRIAGVEFLYSAVLAIPAYLPFAFVRRHFSGGN